MKTYFNLDRISYVIFCVLLFLVPFNTRKVVLNEYSFFSGNYNDLVTYSIYATDIIAFILFLLILTRYRRKILSFLKDESYVKINKVLLIFLIWIGLSVIANHKYFDVSIYKTIRMAEYIWIAIIIKFIVYSNKRLIVSFFIISLSGTIQALIALLQFIRQSSVFGDGIMHKLTGESLIGRDIVGVSNLIFNGEKIIRSYGTFPHPNILAGYLVITILITYYIFNIITEIAQNVKHDNYHLQHFFKILISNRMLQLFFIIEAFGLFATFSRSAFLSFLVVMLVNIFAFKIVPRGTIDIFIKRSYFGNKQKSWALVSTFLIALIVFVALAAVYFFAYRMRHEFINHQSFNDRVFLENVSRETIVDNPIFGVGIGSYILNLHDKFADLNYWQYQPDHNFYLLIASEVGLVSLVLYLYIVYFLYGLVNYHFGQMSIYDHYLRFLFKSLIIGTIILGFFDHYFWTSHQAMMIMWIAYGLLISYVSMKNVSRETFLK